MKCPRHPKQNSVKPPKETCLICYALFCNADLRPETLVIKHLKAKRRALKKKGFEFSQV